MTSVNSDCVFTSATNSAQKSCTSINGRWKASATGSWSRSRWACFSVWSPSRGSIQVTCLVSAKKKTRWLSFYMRVTIWRAGTSSHRHERAGAPARSRNRDGNAVWPWPDRHQVGPRAGSHGSRLSRQVPGERMVPLVTENKKFCSIFLFFTSGFCFRSFKVFNENAGSNAWSKNKRSC